MSTEPDRNRPPDGATLALLILAPATVVASLLGLRSVWATFLIYHLGVCLIVPLVWSLAVLRRTLSQHARAIGLCGPGLSSNVAIGAALGVVMGGGIVAAFAVLGELFLHDQQIRAALADWGVTQISIPLMLLFMVACNGFAEEFFWRGFVHHRLSGWSRRRGAILLAAACHASYHGVTVAVLLRDAFVTALFVLVVLAAGSFWGWLRERTGSVWPAALSHAGATAGYMIVCWQTLAASA